MQKIMLSTILFLAAGLVLTSCNLPASSTSPSATPDLIGTQVSQMLTSMPTATMPPPTLAPTAENTPTPQIIQSSETPTTTASPTTSTTDPRVFLGEPDSTDNLDSGKSFGLDGSSYDDEYTYIRVENGALVMTSKQAAGYHGWRTGGTKVQNAYIEATIRIGECSGQDTYGLVFRSPDYVKGYWFTLTCSGNYAVGYWDGSGYVNIASGSNVDNAILTGSNQVNRVGVMASGNNFGLYVNGKKLADVSDSTFSASGSSGMVIAARSTPNFTIYMDQIAYWNIN